MKKKNIWLAVLAAGLMMSMTACGGKSEPADAGKDDKVSDVEYFADQMSKAMNENAEKKAAERESARNEGDGDQIVIRSVDDFIKFRDRVNGGEPAVDAVLEADLDLSSVCGEGIGNWEPIVKFNGTFEGNGHVIRNLYYSSASEEDFGLFSSTDVDSVIRNLSMEDVNIVGAGHTGAIAGRSSGSIINCQSSGFLEGSGEAVGGIVGRISGDGEKRAFRLHQLCGDFCCGNREIQRRRSCRQGGRCRYHQLPERGEGERHRLQYRRRHRNLGGAFGR